MEIQRKHYIYIKEMNGKVLEKNSMKMIIFCFALPLYVECIPGIMETDSFLIYKACKL